MITRVEQKQHFANKGHRHRVSGRRSGGVWEVVGWSSRGRITGRDSGAGEEEAQHVDDPSQMGDKDQGQRWGGFKNGEMSQPERVRGKNQLFWGSVGIQELLRRWAEVLLMVCRGGELIS